MLLGNSIGSFSCNAFHRDESQRSKTPSYLQINQNDFELIQTLKYNTNLVKQGIMIGQMENRWLSFYITNKKNERQ